MYFDKTINVCQTIDAQTMLSDYKINCILAYVLLTLLGFWKKLLTLLDRMQKRFQDNKTDFQTAAVDIKGLRDIFNNARES